MMDFCEKLAKNQNIPSIYCHARDLAVNFYLKNGWLAEGNYFYEDTVPGVPHLKMRKIL